MINSNNLDEALSWCIDNLEQSNKILEKFTPNNLENKKWEGAVHQLSIHMQIQNNVSIVALKALKEKMNDV